MYKLDEDADELESAPVAALEEVTSSEIVDVLTRAHAAALDQGLLRDAKVLAVALSYHRPPTYEEAAIEDEPDQYEEEESERCFTLTKGEWDFLDTWCCAAIDGDPKKIRTGLSSDELRALTSFYNETVAVSGDHVASNDTEEEQSFTLYTSEWTSLEDFMFAVLQGNVHALDMDGRDVALLKRLADEVWHGI